MLHSLPAKLLFLALAFVQPLSASLLPSPEKSESIVLIGNGLGERMLYFNHFETELQLRHSNSNLVIRNLCKPGDTPGLRPHPSRKTQWAFSGAEQFHPTTTVHLGQGHYPYPDEWLTTLKADTILAFFGYNESFDGPDGVANFTAELEAFIDHSLAQKYNGKSAPHLVLISPIAFEDLSATQKLPNGVALNKNLTLYTQAMKSVSEKKKVGFLDLYAPTAKLYSSQKDQLTINGFLPNDKGYRALATILADKLYGSADKKSSASYEKVRSAVADKNWYWLNDYQMLNGVHVDGRRHKPYGNTNYPEEIEKIRQITSIRDEATWKALAEQTIDLTAADQKTRPLSPVKSNYTKEVSYLDTNKAAEKFALAGGYEASLFASEEEFPELQNPVQMSFDAKGRLWIATCPSYPHFKPGDAKPNDKLLIFEDTDGDGRADKRTVFADGLHVPIGFELAPEGVYIAQQPNLCLLRDLDGDDRADTIEPIVHGFDPHDTHHSISAFCADASGAFYMSEGRFLHSQVETIDGPQRMTDGGVWRFDPKSWKLERYSQTDFSNPWGVAFDEWGQCFISDASGGTNWWGLPLSAKVPHGFEISKIEQFAPKRSRPTSGSEWLYSRHFPDEVQGDFMLCNSIGFLGSSNWAIQDDPADSAGIVGTVRFDLITSDDGNFRPCDLEIAPDGSLYMVDWHNALIGHMQHSARDPKRDTQYGRIYRITYPERPLVEPAKIHGASISALLDNLKLPEQRSRYRTHRELRGRPVDQVLPAVKKWVKNLDSSDPKFELYRLEALWVTWGLGKVDTDLLSTVLHSSDFRARSAAVRILRYTHDDISNSTDLFIEAAQDEHPRVRLSSIVAASWLENEDGARIALAGLKQPITKWMKGAYPAVLFNLADKISALNPSDEEYPSLAELLEKNGQGIYRGSKKKRVKAPSHLPKEFRTAYSIGHEIYHRDGSCVTCHQESGKGQDPAWPTLHGTKWVNGSEERLIKLVHFGLMGPLEIDGKQYNQVMSPVGATLKDHQLAAVLTYVRNSFGNTAPGVKSTTVKRIREGFKDRDQGQLYSPAELLKEHPLED